MEDKIIRVSDLKKVPMFNGCYDKKNANKHFIYGIECVMECIDNMPAYDPVKHGQWLGQIGSGFTPGGNAVYFCSECKWIFGSHRVFPNYKFCPNCGVKMDKGE